MTQILRDSKFPFVQAYSFLEDGLQNLAYELGKLHVVVVVKANASLHYNSMAYKYQVYSTA
jgi:hypothetical protein